MRWREPTSEWPMIQELSAFGLRYGMAGADMFFNVCGFDVSSVERTRTPKGRSLRQPAGGENRKGT